MKPLFVIKAALFMAVMWLAGGTSVSSDNQASNAVIQGSATDQAASPQKHRKATRLLPVASKHFPGNRRLRVELGRASLYEALSDRRDDVSSNQLHRELLKASPGDQAAAVELINVTIQKDADEASLELERDQARHRNRLLLRKAKNQPEKSERRAGASGERGRVKPRYPKTPPNASGERGRVKPRYPKIPPNARP